MVYTQDEAEADGAGVRVPEAVLRFADGGEPAAAAGGGGAARAQARRAAPVRAHAAAHHPHHVPLLRAPRHRRRVRPPRANGALGPRPRAARVRRRPGPEVMIIDSGSRRRAPPNPSIGGCRKKNVDGLFGFG